MSLKYEMLYNAGVKNREEVLEEGILNFYNISSKIEKYIRQIERKADKAKDKSPEIKRLVRELDKLQMSFKRVEVEIKRAKKEKNKNEIERLKKEYEKLTEKFKDVLTMIRSNRYAKAISAIGLSGVLTVFLILIIKMVQVYGESFGDLEAAGMELTQNIAVRKQQIDALSSGEGGDIISNIQNSLRAPELMRLEGELQELLMAQAEVEATVGPAQKGLKAGVGSILGLSGVSMVLRKLFTKNKDDETVRSLRRVIERFKESDR